jgi:hypothetical protein
MIGKKLFGLEPEVSRAPDVHTLSPFGVVIS